MLLSGRMCLLVESGSSQDPTRSAGQRECSTRYAREKRPLRYSTRYAREDKRKDLPSSSSNLLATLGEIVPSYDRSLSLLESTRYAREEMKEGPPTPSLPARE